MLKRQFAIAALIVAALGPSSARAMQIFDPVQVSASAENQFLTLVNRERARHGLHMVTWDNSLAKAGRQHSQEMAQRNYFDHDSPTPGYTTPNDRWTRVVRNTPDNYTLAENIFFGSIPSAQWGHRNLMDSPHHRENILSPMFSRMGVGVYIARDGRMWVTEMFLG